MEPQKVQPPPYSSAPPNPENPQYGFQPAPATYAPQPTAPQQGYPPQPQPNPPQPAQAGSTIAGLGTNIVIQNNQATTGQTTLVGGCPVCHCPTFTTTYDFCAIFLAIFFFPIGILCCLFMAKKKCTSCGYSV